MFQESEIIPYHLSQPMGEKVIVLAPHPDDETLGCGGTLRLLIEAGKRIKVVFLTSGDKADPANKLSHQIAEVEGKCGPGGSSGKAHITAYSLMREKEAERALMVLGVSDYTFLRFPDRELHGGREGVLRALSETAEDFRPDTIYAPSMVELNPDHRAAAALTWEMQSLSGRGSPDNEHLSSIRIIFYEVTTPLRPNILVDISSVYSLKKKAVKQYKSQLGLMDYLRHITAMNAIRALTVSGPRYVEAFWAVDRALSSEEIREWLSYEKVRSE